MMMQRPVPPPPPPGSNDDSFITDFGNNAFAPETSEPEEFEFPETCISNDVFGESVGELDVWADVTPEQTSRKHATKTTTKTLTKTTRRKSGKPDDRRRSKSRGSSEVKESSGSASHGPSHSGSRRTKSRDGKKERSSSKSKRSSSGKPRRKQRDETESSTKHGKASSGHDQLEHADDDHDDNDDNDHDDNDDNDDPPAPTAKELLTELILQEITDIAAAASLISDKQGDNQSHQSQQQSATSSPAKIALSSIKANPDGISTLLDQLRNDREKDEPSVGSGGRPKSKRSSNRSIASAPAKSSARVRPGSRPHKGSYLNRRPGRQRSVEESSTRKSSVYSALSKYLDDTGEEEDEDEEAYQVPSKASRTTGSRSARMQRRGSGAGSVGSGGAETVKSEPGISSTRRRMASRRTAGRSTKKSTTTNNAPRKPSSKKGALEDHFQASNHDDKRSWNDRSVASEPAGRHAIDDASFSEKCKEFKVTF